MGCQRGANDQRRNRGATGFAKPHPQVEDRLLAKGRGKPDMPRFRRQVGDHAVIKRIKPPAGRQCRRRRRADESVKHHRDPAKSRFENGAGDGGQLAPAIGGEQADATFDSLAMAVDGGLDDHRLVGDA